MRTTQMSMLEAVVRCVLVSTFAGTCGTVFPQASPTPPSAPASAASASASASAARPDEDDRGSNRSGDIPSSSRQVLVSTSAFFAQGAPTLNAEAKAALDRFALNLDGLVVQQVTIAGFANADGSATFNQLLAQRRATAVKVYLASKMVVAPSRILLTGTGATTPHASTPEAQARFRRVDIEVVGIEKPAPNPPGSKQIVYNALIAPQLVRSDKAPTETVLALDQPTTLTFKIGERIAGSALSPKQPNALLMASSVDVPITVVFSCSFCRQLGSSRRQIVYRVKERQSDEVVFAFVPQALRQVKGEETDNRLQISVIDDRTSTTYDRLVIPVAVGKLTGNVLPADKQVGISLPTARANPELLGGPRAPWPDITLVLTEDRETISVQVRAMRQEVDDRLSEIVKLKGSDKDWRTFRTTATRKELEQVAAPAYVNLVQLATQKDLTALAANKSGAKPPAPAASSLQFTKNQASAVSELIAGTGQVLYQRLFVDTGEVSANESGADGPSEGQSTALVDVIQAIEALAASEAYANRPLRVLVQANTLSLPWQYLHPPGSPNIYAFWGHRFNLVVDRLNTGAEVTSSDDASAAARKVVFARHGSATDVSVPFAKDQITLLKKLPVDDLMVVESGKVFLLDALTRDRASVSAVITFLHASSGKAILPVGSTNVIVDTTDGPRLEFGSEDFVTSSKLDERRSRISIEEQKKKKRYLAGSPLVILNACGTGASATRVPYVQLQDALFRMGAQGVLVTEVVVWATLGHYVGSELIQRLGKGETISDALTAVRLQLVKEKQNPLGLLYMYYGDPASVLRR